MKYSALAGSSTHSNTSFRNPPHNKECSKNSLPSSVSISSSHSAAFTLSMPSALNNYRDNTITSHIFFGNISYLYSLSKTICYDCINYFLIANRINFNYCVSKTNCFLVNIVN
ncbi:protein of unknown function [Nitrospina watsonii]|uniref:Uncharacterized protein n=1 Tax=Nitrospina watsonii TaxID=1323948 RepID=A0ABM9HA76_9BACT|nr:protein of unknown function [Nitrospina watsonii]